MRRMFEVLRHAAVFVTAAGVVVLVARPGPRMRPSNDAPPSAAADVPNGPVVYRIYERAEPGHAPADSGHAPPDPSGLEAPVDATTAQDASPAEPRLDPEQRAAMVERSHVLLDAIVDAGVADAARADELRELVSRLPAEDRLELYARLSIAVNHDGLEVDPAHLPM